MKENRKEFQELLLAAWFHDIGKFYQRAGFKLNTAKDEEVMTLFAKRKQEGTHVQYSHRHAIFSDKFFREYLYLPAYDNAGTLVALHHSPENANNDRIRYLAKIITLADWMASGERRERESEEDSEGYQAEPLISIFSRLYLDDSEDKKKKVLTYIPLAALEGSLDNLFPVASKDQAFKEGDGQKSYEVLWHKFLADLEKIDKRFLLEQVPFLLEKFTLTIPATTVDKPDLSLYHHAKSTAAISSCLYKLQLDEKIIDDLFNEIREWLKPPIQEREISLKQNRGVWPNLIKEDFLLVGGDISGIQDFIYSVTSEKALKGLKGRSFYLQLISEATGLLILNEFDLTEANLLYSGGGHFYLLVPRVKDAEGKLKDLRQRVDEVLLQAHKGKLALILDWVSLTYADFFINFVSAWANLTTKLGQLKKKKFASLFTAFDLKRDKPRMKDSIAPGDDKESEASKQNKLLEKIIGPFDIGGERKACEICGEELEKKEEGEEETCSLCQSFVSLSDDLKRATAIKLERKEAQPLPTSPSVTSWKNVLLALGFECHFWWPKKDEDPFKTKKEGEGGLSYLPGYLLLNSTDFAGHFAGYKFIATKITGPDGTTLTLEDMANQAEGIKKWGVLRADVDRLGEVFTQGLGDDKTISRMCMLSSMLSLYFGARLNDLKRLKEENSEKEGNKAISHFSELPTCQDNLLDYIYIAYSGGDDLFLIGPWSVLPNLAIRLYDDFHRFTSKKLTLSAGLYLAPTKKFPIYQAALEAGEAESLAKKANGQRICFLETPMTNKKIKEVREVAYRIRNLLQGQIKSQDEKLVQLAQNSQTKVKAKLKTVPRSLLSVLYDAHQDKELRRKGEIPMERIWRLFYAFKKVMEKFKKDEEVLRDLNWLLKKAITDYEIYPELNVAARWAEYLTREEKT